jgi:hypothetical protein
MAVLQVNALFKKAAPAPAKKGTAKKAAPAPKKVAPKKAAPAPKKVAPKKTVVRKAAPVKKSSGKSAQAGSDASKWYGTYHLLPPPSPKSAKSSKSARIRHPTTPPTIVGSRARARSRDAVVARLDRIDESRASPAFASPRAIQRVASSSRDARRAASHDSTASNPDDRRALEADATPKRRDDDTG